MATQFAIVDIIEKCSELNSALSTPIPSTWNLRM
jgi:hypothetical protein